jgi:CDP-ribitol ribitolphosphotransferase
MEEIIRRDEFIIEKISCSALSINKSSVQSILKSILRALSFFTVKAYHLATSKYIFMNDNFMPMGKLKFREQAVITQLWHADGAFKKFGLHIEQPDDIRELELAGNRKLSYVVCSSESVSDIYAEAFGVSPYKVLPLGSPRTDYFFRPINEKNLREKFDKKYPECQGKKLVLYAPTFRDNKNEDLKLLDNFDVEAFNERFGDEYELLIRLHPQVHTDARILENVVNVGDYENVSELLRLVDILITDYSSICMDFALMEKPIYYYAFDFDTFDTERSFYFNYETYIPGPVSKDFQTLLNLMSSNISETYRKRMYDFKFLNFGTPDGHASKRVVDRVIYNIT